MVKYYNLARCMVYLPLHLLDFYGKCIGKHTIHPGREKDTSGLDDRREEIRSSLLQFHDETIFGMIRFDRKKQNVGRLPVTWWNPSIFGPSFWGD